MGKSLGKAKTSFEFDLDFDLGLNLGFDLGFDSRLDLGLDFDRQISEISNRAKFFVTKLTTPSDRTRRAEQKSFSELPPGGPLEFSRNSQSLKNGCFGIKLLSNWGSTQTMHGAVE